MDRGPILTLFCSHCKIAATSSRRHVHPGHARVYRLQTHSHRKGAMRRLAPNDMQYRQPQEGSASSKMLQLRWWMTFRYEILLRSFAHEFVSSHAAQRIVHEIMIVIGANDDELLMMLAGTDSPDLDLLDTAHGEERRCSSLTTLKTGRRSSDGIAILYSRKGSVGRDVYGETSSNVNNKHSRLVAISAALTLILLVCRLCPAQVAPGSSGTGSTCLRGCTARWLRYTRPSKSRAPWQHLPCDPSQKMRNQLSRSA